MLEWVFLLIAAWLAATISGAAGFGGALILLPVLTHAVGAKAAIPVLTLAQLLGNASRAGFGWREIRWRPVAVFSLGALPACALGAWSLVALPGPWVTRGIGAFLLAMVALRHTGLGRRPLPEPALAGAGAGVGFLSAVVGSAGPLGAAAFLSLQLPAGAYVASEAVTATLMHLTKSVLYGRYALLTPQSVTQGLGLGLAMVLGSWTGRRVIERLPRRAFAGLVEGLLVVSAIALLVP